MVIRPFEQWLFEDVEMEFGIERAEDMPQLLTWLNTDGIDQAISPQFEKLRVMLLRNVDGWNEDALSCTFLGGF